MLYKWGEHLTSANDKLNSKKITMSNPVIIQSSFTINSGAEKQVQDILSKISDSNVSTSLDQKSNTALVKLTCNDLSKLPDILKEIGPVIGELEKFASPSGVQYSGPVPEKLLKQLEPFEPKVMAN